MECWLEVIEGSLKGFVLALEEGSSWVIGRDPEACSLVLEDPDVDRKQLLCSLVEDGYQIENLSESNPVLFNGNLLTSPQFLHSGDRISLGRLVLVWRTSAETTDSVETDIEKESPEEESFTSGIKLHTETSADSAEDDWIQMVTNQPFDEAAEEISDISDSTADEEIEENDEATPPELRDEEFHLDVSLPSRFVLKVIAGPNAGAEFSLDLGKSYLIGTDTTTCDIIFYDLSVSREHARLSLSSEGEVTIEDLHSRNGILVDQQKITGTVQLSAHSIVILGTTVFFLVDQDAPQETLVTPVIEALHPEPPPQEQPEEPHAAHLESPLEEKPADVPVSSQARFPHLSVAIVLASILLGLLVLLGYGVIALSSSKDASTEMRSTKDDLAELNAAIQDFPGVRYTYNRNTGQLFLVGHVTSSTEYSELLYNLQGCHFLRGIQNHVLNDEAIWQEMNLILARHPEFKGVTMHSPVPGHFVLTGYLKTEQQENRLNEYLNLHFNYIYLLENQVIVESRISSEIAQQLLMDGFGAITSNFSNGELVLTGYVNAGQEERLHHWIEKVQQQRGVRQVQNFVIIVTADEQVIDLSQRYPGRYVVTGYSKHGDININVVINGKILMRGDTIDQMTVTSIHPHAVFLEKDGLQYKIEYNT